MLITVTMSQYGLLPIGVVLIGAMFTHLKTLGLRLAEFNITFVQIFIIGASVALMVGLYFFVEKTKMR